MITDSEPVVHDAFEITLRISVPRQILEVVKDGRVESAYPISTSKFGLGSEPGSYKTPVGRFRIAEKIGADAPLNAVFKSRELTGEIAQHAGEEDLILTRILWLDGLDPANANTHDRYVYIHGTNQEARIGSPASHGCVRMRNSDIVRLFESVPEGTIVEIIS
ncbi:cell wall-recycling L,D-carboxypeptidase ElsL [soil metagenome]